MQDRNLCIFVSQEALISLHTCWMSIATGQNPQLPSNHEAVRTWRRIVWKKPSRMPWWNLQWKISRNFHYGNKVRNPIDLDL